MRGLAGRAVLALLVLGCIAQPPVAAADGYPIEGQIALLEGAKSHLALSRVMLHAEDGREFVAFPKRDGSFVLHDVPPGTHVLGVDCMSLIFPQLRVDVNGRRGGAVTAAYADNPALSLDTHPLIIKPLAPAQYFDVRKPFSVLQFLKSPMGMMMAFMVFAVLVMPYLKVDPQEYQELMNSVGRGTGDGAPQQGQRQLPASGGASGGAKQRTRGD